MFSISFANITQNCLVLSAILTKKNFKTKFKKNFIVKTELRENVFCPQHGKICFFAPYVPPIKDSVFTRRTKNVVLYT